MSERLELVRRIYDAWERGDFSDASWADPEIEFVSVFPGAAPATGREALGASWGEWLHQWREFRVTAEDYLERGDDVLVLSRFAGAGKGSGVAISDFGGAALFTIRDGSVVRLALYEDRTAANAEFEARASER